MPPIHTRLWLLLVDTCATYLAFEVPFGLLFLKAPNATQRVVDACLSVILAADFLIRLSSMRRAARAAGNMTGGRRPPAFSWELVADFVAAIPVRLFMPGTPLELLRLFKVPRVIQDLHRLRYEHIEYWTIFRLVVFSYWFTLVVHWLSCGWIAIRGEASADDIWTTYNKALYWCITTLATVGYGDVTPQTNIERLYAMGVMVLGVGMFSISIATVAAIVMEMKPEVARHMEQMQRVVSFMRRHHIPTELQHKIRDYFTFIWDRELGSDESALMARLPASLKADVSIILTRDFIECVPFFRSADDVLLREIALEMRSVVFAPRDYICVAGEPGAEMYFIEQGKVEILSKDESTVFRVQAEGTFFGEIAILTDMPRTANVRALEFCRMYSLRREAVQRIAGRHPAFARLLDEARRERMAIFSPQPSSAQAENES